MHLRRHRVLAFNMLSSMLILSRNKSRKNIPILISALCLLFKVYGASYYQQFLWKLMCIVLLGAVIGVDCWNYGKDDNIFSGMWKQGFAVMSVFFFFFFCEVAAMSVWY